MKMQSAAHLRRCRRYDVGSGRSLSVGEIATVARIAKSTVRMRLDAGISGADLLLPQAHAQRMARTPAERIEDGSIPEPNTGCWLWLAGKRATYGFTAAAGRRQQAHRASWVAHYGPIPAGLWVLHKCDTPSCVNPEHLWLGTNADNTADRVRKGRSATHNLPRACGPEHPMAKLNAAEVAEIRRLYGSIPTPELARRFGVSASNVWKIGTRRSHREAAA